MYRLVQTYINGYRGTVSSLDRLQQLTSVFPALGAYTPAVAHVAEHDHVSNGPKRT